MCFSVCVCVCALRDSIFIINFLCIIFKFSNFILQSQFCTSLWKQKDKFVTRSTTRFCPILISPVVGLLCQHSFQWHLLLLPLGIWRKKSPKMEIFLISEFYYILRIVLALVKSLGVLSCILLQIIENAISSVNTTLISILYRIGLLLQVVCVSI